MRCGSGTSIEFDWQGCVSGDGAPGKVCQCNQGELGVRDATEDTNPTVLGTEELQWLKTGNSLFDIPREFVGIMDKERRCKLVPNDYETIEQ